MAGQTELVELKRATEEMSQKMDKQMTQMLTLLQRLVNFFTSTVPNSDMGLNADDARIEEPPQIYPPLAVRIKPYSKVKLSDMFKDLAEFHDARTHPKVDVGSLSKNSAEREDTYIDKINPKVKRVYPVDSITLYSCETRKAFVKGPPDTTMNPQSS